MFIKMILSLLKIGIIGYGGGSATLPLIKADFVDKYKIMSEDEFIEVVGICNTLPGPIITKFCAVLGYKIKGVFGAVVAVISLILPSSIMMLIILEFIKGSGENIHVTNMINAIMPVVTVILTLLIFDFIKMSKTKMARKELIIALTIFTVLLIVLKVNAAITILGFVIACLLVPKREGE